MLEILELFMTVYLKKRIYPRYYIEVKVKGAIGNCNNLAGVTFFCRNTLPSPLKGLALPTFFIIPTIPKAPSLPVHGEGRGGRRPVSQIAPDRAWGV
jgi:hypothetical protein